MQVLAISQLQKETFPQQPNNNNHNNKPDFSPSPITEPVRSWESLQRAAHPDAPPNQDLDPLAPVAVTPHTTKMGDRDYGDDVVVDKQWVSFNSRISFHSVALYDYRKSPFFTPCPTGSE